jgi:hypothetical protein
MWQVSLGFSSMPEMESNDKQNQKSKQQFTRIELIPVSAALSD